MGRFHDSVPTRLYAYRCAISIPADAEARMLEQLKEAHRYRNALVAIERNRRVRAAKILADFHPAIAAADAKLIEIETSIETLRTEIKANNAKARKRLKDPERTQRIKSLQVDCKAVRLRRKEAKQIAKHHAPTKAAFSILYEESTDAIKAERKKSLATWGTRAAVEQALAASTKAAGPGPEFRRWQWSEHQSQQRLVTGTLAIQVQGGLTMEELLGSDDTRCRIQLPGGEKTWQHAKRGDRRRAAKQAVLWFRIGSNPDRTPQWIQLPFIMHRGFPAGSKVTWVFLDRRVIAHSVYWYVRFAIANPDGFEDPARRAKAGTVGVDVGYRRVKDGLRVAYWVGSDGRKGEFAIPEVMLGAQDKCRDLQSIRDTEFDAVLLETRRQLAALSDKPEWLVNDTEFLGLWKSHNRLLELTAKWAKRRFTGDEDLFEKLQAWTKQEIHLHAWEAHQRVKTSRRRKDMYRNFARQLGREYKTVIMEKLDLREFQKLPQPEEKAPEGAVRHHQRMARLSDLFTCIHEVFGTERKLRDAANTTRECNHCHHINQWEEAANLHQTCGNCGQSWDQDENAARNLLESPEPPAEETPETEPDVDSDNDSAAAA